MLGKREALQGGSLAVAVLLVTLALLGQGCERWRTEKQAEPAGSSAVTAEEGTSPGPPAEPTRQADRPVTSVEEKPEPEPVEATVVTDASFAEVTRKGVVLVDFWAERCPPCRMQGPIVEGLAKKFAGRATIGKLDVDANASRRTPRKFRIMYIPTLIIFKDGREVKRFTGLQSKATLTAALEEALRGE